MKKFVIIVLIIVITLMATGCGSTITLESPKTMDDLLADYISCPKDIFDALDSGVSYISIKHFGHEVGCCYAVVADDGSAVLYLGSNMLNCTDNERELFTEQIEDYFEENNLILDNIIFVEEYC